MSRQTTQTLITALYPRLMRLYLLRKKKERQKTQDTEQ